MWWAGPDHLFKAVVYYHCSSPPVITLNRSRRTSVLTSVSQMAAALWWWPGTCSAAPAALRWTHGPAGKSSCHRPLGRNLWPEALVISRSTFSQRNVLLHGPGFQRLNMSPKPPLLPSSTICAQVPPVSWPHPPTARPKASPQRPGMLWDSSLPSSVPPYFQVTELSAQCPHLSHSSATSHSKRWCVCFCLSPPTGWLSLYEDRLISTGESAAPSPAHRRHLHILRWLWWGGVLTGDELAGLELQSTGSLGSIEVTAEVEWTWATRLQTPGVYTRQKEARRGVR